MVPTRLVPIEGIFDERRPPGLSWRAYPVVKNGLGCATAAEARGIPVSHECKSLILETEQGLFCANLPGDKKLGLHAVKKHLGCKAWLCSPETLHSLGLASGKVSVVLDPTWSMPLLVSRDPLQRRFVTTNNGTLQGSYVFDPRVLLRAKDVRLGSFTDNLMDVGEAQCMPSVPDGLVQIRDWSQT
jgi:prolyl-tRNA editing enzyme YbaK/EbsC (Cys-tRNA(Pro) deacylase)